MLRVCLNQGLQLLLGSMKSFHPAVEAFLQIGVSFSKGVFEILTEFFSSFLFDKIFDGLPVKLDLHLLKFRPQARTDEFEST